MEQHFSLADEAFEQQFANCTLNPALFTHEAHLRLAWIHVTRYGREKAIQNVISQLQQFVNFAGATGKYNHTVTIAAVKAVAHFVNKSSSRNFNDFINEFPRLKTNFRDIIQAHYKTDVFKSAVARKEFVAPDLLPFD